MQIRIINYNYEQNADCLVSTSLSMSVTMPVIIIYELSITESTLKVMFASAQENLTQCYNQ